MCSFVHLCVCVHAYICISWFVGVQAEFVAMWKVCFTLGNSKKMLESTVGNVRLQRLTLAYRGKSNMNDKPNQSQGQGEQQSGWVLPWPPTQGTTIWLLHWPYCDVTSAPVLTVIPVYLSHFFLCGPTADVLVLLSFSLRHCFLCCFGFGNFMSFITSNKYTLAMVLFSSKMQRPPHNL